MPELAVSEIFLQGLVGGHFFNAWMCPARAGYKCADFLCDVGMGVSRNILPIKTIRFDNFLKVVKSFGYRNKKSHPFLSWMAFTN